MASSRRRAAACREGFRAIRGRRRASIRPDLANTFPANWEQKMPRTSCPFHQPRSMDGLQWLLEVSRQRTAPAGGSSPRSQACDAGQTRRRLGCGPSAIHSLRGEDTRRTARESVALPRGVKQLESGLPAGAPIERRHIRPTQTVTQRPLMPAWHPNSQEDNESALSPHAGL